MEGPKDTGYWVSIRKYTTLTFQDIESFLIACIKTHFHSFDLSTKSICVMKQKLKSLLLTFFLFKIDNELIKKDRICVQIKI